MSTTPELNAVARAIACVNYGVDGSNPYVSINDAHIAMARAALRAIRDPTEEMLPHMYHGPIINWQKTIDYILSEPSP